MSLDVGDSGKVILAASTDALGLSHKPANDTPDSSSLNDLVEPAKLADTLVGTHASDGTPSSDDAVRGNGLDGATIAAPLAIDGSGHVLTGDDSFWVDGNESSANDGVIADSSADSDADSFAVVADAPIGNFSFSVFAEAPTNNYVPTAASIAVTDFGVANFSGPDATAAIGGPTSTVNSATNTSVTDTDGSVDREDGFAVFADPPTDNFADARTNNSVPTADSIANFGSANFRGLDGTNGIGGPTSTVNSASNPSVFTGTTSYEAPSDPNYGATFHVTPWSPPNRHNFACTAFELSIQRTNFCLYRRHRQWDGPHPHGQRYRYR